jgi:phospholipase C
MRNVAPVVASFYNSANHMLDPTRRRFLKLAARSAGAAAALSVFPPSIRRALAIPAATGTGTIQDVEHVVILMLENRSFDHYFGTLRGVRGFADRHPVPLEGGKTVWRQSDGTRDVAPFHLDTKTTSALRAPSTPHSFKDAQAAWNQGKFGLWAKYKTPMSLGHYRREDIPFQFALAEAFTICDAHHCSVTTGTDPNRIAFWSGSNFDPEARARGENCTEANSEPDNLRCWIKGALPTPGYTYAGSALTWPTIPDVLERAGIRWRMYQDPNDNWTGAMHGGLAFESFRGAQPGSPLYENGMSHHSLEELKDDVGGGRLPQVSWVLPPMIWSEHPAPSSPLQGAEFTSRVLDALTTNPEVWSRTVFILTFDENDGLFDHVPPPAPPSYNLDGALAGGATLDLRGEYFSDPERRHLHPEDLASGTVRPWGLGPRVPLYVISPWSRGGWVNSQVFDHSSIAQFLERRFGVTIPAISPWHRAVCGDLTTAFDFATPNEDSFPQLPTVTNSAAVIASIEALPRPAPPAAIEKLFQEPGTRRSRALPYELHVDARVVPAKVTSDTPAHAGAITLTFRNTGLAGAVLHVYDRLHLDRIPRRYTVEASKSLAGSWPLQDDDGRYDLWVYGPNGFVRELRGVLHPEAKAAPRIAVEYDVPNGAIRLVMTNPGRSHTSLTVRANAYRTDGPWVFHIAPHSDIVHELTLIGSHGWYDLTILGEHLEERFAGRMETGMPSASDPAV